MKKLTTILSAGLALSILSFGLLRQQSAHAQSGYSLNSIKGTFGFVEQGSLGVNNPMSGVGLLTIKGDGAVTGFEKVQYFGSTLQTIAVTGNYEVNADGTGNLTLNYPNDGVNTPIVVD